MKKFFSLMLAVMLILSMLTVVAMADGTSVAKVGDIEYATIDEAIANWTNNTTLTLLADVTLSDVIKLSSQEHHYLELSTYTMTAASDKDAIEIVSYGRANRSESGALTITANAGNPGGINAGSKACITYKYDSTLANNQYDRPIIYIKGGIFDGSSYSGIKSNGHSTAQDKCATFNISGGIFNCGINLTKAKLLISGGIFNNSVGCTGGSTSIRVISGGTFKSFGFMTADSNNTKFWIGTSMGNSNVGTYIDDNGYLVVGGPVITEPGTTFEASSPNHSNAGFGSYLTYSSAATNGIYYTSVEEALADNNKAGGSVTVYDVEDDTLDMTDYSSFKGTIILANDAIKITCSDDINLRVGTTAKEADGTPMVVAYKDITEDGVTTRTYEVVSEEEAYTVTYTDGLVNVNAFEDKVFEPLLKGGNTPEYEPEEFNYPGYNFDKWSPEVAETVTEDATYTANWTPIIYTIAYNLDGGSVASKNPETYMIVSKAFTLTNPTKTGYTFIGWTEDGQTEPEKTVTIETGSTGNKAYTANWQVNEYTISFDTRCNAYVAPIEVAYGASIPTLPIPFRQGYEFTGWEGIPADGKMPAGDITLTASWRQTYFQIDTPVKPITPVTPVTPVEPEVDDDSCDGKLSSGCAAATFADLDSSAWYHDAVDYVLENGLMQGVGGGKFAPYTTTSRAMIVTILYRLEGEPVVGSANPFSDVEADEWYTDAVLWAAENEIVLGYDGAFMPEDEITLEQALLILQRYAEYKGADEITVPMIAPYEYNTWAENGVVWAYLNGVLEIGTDLDDLTAPATRAELAGFLYAFCER